MTRAKSLGWNPTEILPELDGIQGDDSRRESARLLVWVSDSYPSKLAFGRCVKHSQRVYWYAEGFSREFNISHWRYLPKGPE